MWIASSEKKQMKRLLIYFTCKKIKPKLFYSWIDCPIISRMPTGCWVSITFQSEVSLRKEKLNIIWECLNIPSNFFIGSNIPKFINLIPIKNFLLLKHTICNNWVVLDKFSGHQKINCKLIKMDTRIINPENVSHAY